MRSLIRSLALGGAWGVLWCLAEALGHGLTGLPGCLGLVLLFCLGGGAAGGIVGARALRRMPRNVALAIGLGLMLVWCGTFFPLHALLTINFEPSAGLVALCATWVAALVMGAVLIGLLLNRRRGAPAGAWAALPAALLALLAALLGSLVTPEFPKHAWLTAAAATASACLATLACTTAMPQRWLQARRWPSGAAAAAVALWAGGLLLYSQVESLRAATWQDSALARSLARSVVALTDLDGDGISGSLGHPDCDDGSPSVFPGAPDFPGNGKDDNCLAGEAQVDEVLALWQPPDGPRAKLPPAPLDFERRRYNVVLLTMDATRADHTSLYGYERSTTPNLERFAAISLVFENAWSASNHSRVSLYSLFTGRYASAFHRGDQVLPTPGASLIEQLQVAGYQTECLVDFFPRIRHLYSGCAQLDDSMGARAAVLAVGNRSVGSTAEELAALALLAVDRMARSSRPTFLWVHCSEAHSEYLRHADFDFGERPIDRYDGEIAFVDRAYNRILTRLGRTGRLQDTLVVITGDHGESFGEHGTHTHGHNLYEEQIHVPLVIYLPSADGGGFRPARVAAPIDLTDVAPTVLDALGLEPRMPMHGESLLPHVLQNRPLRTPEAYSEVKLPYARAQALRRGQTKLIIDHLVGAVHRFDLDSDPHERRPVTGDAADAEAFGRWIDRHLAFPGPEYQASGR